jgi:DNA segregation ATPase FtsK/SpoIIIE, S-DNA-T family
MCGIIFVNMARTRRSIRGSEVKKETWQAVIAIACFILALLAILAAFHKVGIVGDYAYRIMNKLLGIGYFLFPILLIMLGISFLKGVEQKFQTWKVIGSILFFISGLGLIDLLMAHEGGILGRYISRPLISLFDVYATAIILVGVLTVSILITFDIHFTADHLLFWRRWQKDGEEDEDEKAAYVDDEKIDKTVEEIEKKYKEEEEDEEVQPKIAVPKEDEMEGAFGSFISTRSNKPFEPPPLSLLEKDKGKPETGDIKANANIIKRTLANFGISVEMDEISIGPSVTRYALKPAEGVKLAKIVALNNDLALALAAHPIRIEAPIPGKSLVGIEMKFQTPSKQQLVLRHSSVRTNTSLRKSRFLFQWVKTLPANHSLPTLRRLPTCSSPEPLVLVSL